jgi:hypothetical protein
MNPDQKKYLRERLQRINNSFGTYGHYAQSRKDSILPKPAAIVEAEKRIARDSALVRRFEKRQSKRSDKIKKAKRAMADLCERTILLGDFKKALNLLDQFDSMKF